MNQKEYQRLKDKYFRSKLTSAEYDKMRKYELNNRYVEEEGMRKYRQYLNGTNHLRGKGKKYHIRAQEKIRKLHKYMTLKQIGNTSNAFSYSAILRLYNGQFNDISEGYASSICSHLNRVLDNIQAQSEGAKKND